MSAGKLSNRVAHVRESYVPCDHNPLEIDEGNCVIRGVKVLGTNARNKGRKYPRHVIEAAQHLYHNKPVNINHPKDQDVHRDFNERFGWLDNIRMGEDGLYADLHYNPEHEKAKKVLYFARNNPRMLGLSPDHYIRETVDPKDGARTVAEIVHVHAVDLVADPSTTTGLKEALEMDPLADPPADADANAADGNSLQSLKEHINKMVEEATGGITDAATLRKLSEKIEKLLGTIGGADGTAASAASAVEEADDADAEAEETEALRRSSDPAIKALMRQIDVLSVREAANRKALDLLRVREAAAGQRDLAIKQCREALLPDYAITDVFVDDLVKCDRALQDKLIADRKALLSSNKGKPAVSLARESIEKVAPNGKPADAPSVDDFIKEVRY